MLVIAVAGGTGGLGRTIVEAILATKKYSVVILGRKPNIQVETMLGVPVLAVDYGDIESTTKVLEDNSVHTVISTINMIPVQGPPKEVELIRACDASKTTRRFIPSNWGVPVSSFTDEDETLMPSVYFKRQGEKTLRESTDLEYTSILNGFFLDYFGRPGEQSYMAPLTVVLDLENGEAAIPGSGKTPVVFTHTLDVAKFVAAALDLEKWDTQYYIVGNKMTWNEFLKLAEIAKGSKFKVTYDSLDLLKSGKVTELPSHVPAYQFMPKEMLQAALAAFGYWFDSGLFNLEPENIPLNEVFPEIKIQKLDKFLRDTWGGQ